MVSCPGSGRSPGGGNGNPFQFACLDNPMDRGAWQAIDSSPWGHKESDPTEHTHKGMIHYHLYCITLYVLFFMNYYFLLLLISITTFLFKVGHSLVLCIYLIHIYLTVVDTYLFDCGGS